MDVTSVGGSVDERRRREVREAFKKSVTFVGGDKISKV